MTLVQCAVGVALASVPALGDACDRRMLGAARVAAMADVALEGTVSSVAGDRAEIAVKRVLKGSAGKSATIGKIPANAFMTDCLGTPPKPGATYLFLAFAPTASQPFLWLVDPVEGLAEGGSAQAQALEKALAAKLPATAWSAPASGVAMKAVLERPEFQAHDDVDVMLVFRNVSEAKTALHYRSWPRETAARCELTGLPAKPVPISDADIAGYFAEHGPKFDVDLAPGETFELVLDRVTTAKPGWGYKERLGFRYFPLAAGTWTTGVKCLNFTTEPLEAPGLVLRIR